jgi:hypothetical protein
MECSVLKFLKYVKMFRRALCFLLQFKVVFSVLMMPLFLKTLVYILQLHGV